MNQLTEAQKQRMHENRQNALQRRAEAVARSQALLLSSPPCAGVHVPNVATSKSITAPWNQPTLLNVVNISGCDPRIQTSSYSQSQTSNVSGIQSTSGTFSSTSSGVSTSRQFHLKNNQTSGQPIKATFVLLTRKRFFVEVIYNQQVIETFKTISSRVYDAKTKRWNFLLEHHDELVTKLKAISSTVLFSPLPRKIVKLFSNAPDIKKICEQDLSTLDPVLLNALLPFQLEGVKFGIQQGGKVLIADDMGLGKTIQAIAIANYFKNDWPLLVVTPSSVRYSWLEAFQTWLPSYSDNVSVINTGKDHITNDKIVILSYDLLSRKKDEILLRKFRSVILDESHFLKNGKSARTKAAQMVMKNLRRIIMLSGTPALSRPVELFPQVSAINPSTFSDFMDFGIRYCNGKKMPWGWDFSGSSNMEELQLLMEETTMIRRLKSEVIKQLPPKVRQVILLDTSRLVSQNKVLGSMSKKMTVKNLTGMERRGVLLEYYHQTGITKLPAVCEYIKDLLESDKKFLCFAHHHVVMDGIEKAINEAKIEYIRIDGSTPSALRKLLCDKFQMRDNCKIALLSITAANSGITLTAAHLVIFAELFWNPGILVQAEDRAHRIGQEDSVMVQYLVAKGTADDEMWTLIQKKLNILNKAGLSKDNFSNADAVEADNSAQQHIEELWFDLGSEIDNAIEIDNIPCKRKKVP